MRFAAISAILAVPALVTLFPAVPYAGDILVNSYGTGDYATIQDAVDAAVPGDRILLQPGTYTGTGNKNIDTHGLEITIVSVEGAGNTIIDCENDGRALYMDSGETNDTVIRGITIRNGEAATLDEKGGGIYCDNASPTIKECAFEYNYAHVGAALYLNQSNARIIRNRFIENNCAMNCDSSGGSSTEGDDGAIYCYDSDAIIVDNYFYKNQGYFGSSGAITGKQSTLTIVGNEFETNSNVHCGGPVCADSSEVLILGNRFYDNSGEGNSAVSVSRSTAVVRANWIHDNRPHCISGGVSAHETDLVMDFNLLADNGGAGAFVSNSAGDIYRNIFTRAGGICMSAGLGIGVSESPGIVVKNNVLYENADGETWYGTEMRYQGASPTITCNILVNSKSSPMVVCDATPTLLQQSPAAVDTFHQVYNFFWGDVTAWQESISYGCIADDVFYPPMFCDPSNDNWFLQAGSMCEQDTLFPGGGMGGNDLYWYGFSGALPVGCGTSDVLATTVPADAVVTSVAPGDLYTLSGFTITNTSTQEAPVYYRLLFDDQALPDDKGDPYAFVGVSPVLEPGETHTPPEAALIVPEGAGIVASAVTYLVAYAPALNMPDTLTTTITFDLITSVVSESHPALVLYQNVPNPFNPATTISYTLPEAAFVTLSIYSVVGKLVRTLESENKSPGTHTVVWNGRDRAGTVLSSGVYFYRLQAGDRTLTRKMLLLK